MLMHTKLTPPDRPTFLKAYWAALLWAAFILLLMSLPGKDLLDFDIWAIDIEDKLGHIGVFGLLAMFMVWGIAQRNSILSKKSLWTAFIIASLYGGVTEILQGVAFPSRFASVPDFVADTIGAALGTVFALFVFNKLRRQKS